MAFLYQLLGSKIWPPVDKQLDLSGRTLLITGANSGLGYEAALKLVRCSAKRVVLGVRSMEKGLAVRQEILDQTKRPNIVIDVYQLDMLDYGSIQAFASRVSQEVSCLDYVILNAGVSPQTYRKSRYGYEQALQVNLLSNTLLALLLLPHLMASKTDDFTPVLEIVGSGTHQRIPTLLPGTDDMKMDPLEVYNSEKSFALIGFMQQYSMTKLFLMYAQWQLVNLVADPNTKKPRAFVVVVGPGPTQSGLGRDASEQPLASRLVFSGIHMLMKTAEQGSRTYISGLMLGEQGHGQFWQWDSIERPAKWCSDPLAVQRSNRVWTSIIDALKKDVKDIDNIVARVGSI